MFLIWILQPRCAPSQKQEIPMMPIKKCSMLMNFHFLSKC